MKTRYIITIDQDEEGPVCITKEWEPGAITVFIIARTPEEANGLVAQARLQAEATA